MKKLNKFILFGATFLLVSSALASCKNEETINYGYDKYSETSYAYSDMTLLGRMGLNEDVIILDNYNDSPVTAINSYTFFRCENLMKVSLPNTLKVIGSNAFYGCQRLQSITLNEGLEVIDTQAFMYSGIDYVYIPSSVSRIGLGAYAGCNVETFEISEDNLVFDSSSDINGIVNKQTGELICANASTKIPSTVTSIQTYAYYDVMELEKIEIPSTVKRIESNAFYYCESLKEVYLDKSLEYIGINAFEKSAVTDIYFTGTEREFRAISSNLVGSEQEITVHASDKDFVIWK